EERHLADRFEEIFVSGVSDEEWPDFEPEAKAALGVNIIRLDPLRLFSEETQAGGLEWELAPVIGTALS
ncbi:MAG: hypothetical protein KAI64_05905, partial [Thermoplasmata archaeon]|nr:hypothetical protein [Thermoplasmata archaeon]